MSNFFEGFFLCLGVGFFYLAASANDTGEYPLAVVALSLGLVAFTLMILVASDRGRLK